jgi:RND family efflux transporter MFP subunit
MDVKPETASVSRRYTGTIRARYETGYGFRVGGKITERRVDVGDVVSKGQIIARLDDTDLKLEVQAAEAEVEAAKTSRETANANLIRQRKLRRGGWAAPAKLDDAISLEREASTRLERAERSFAVLSNQVSYATLNSDIDGIVTAVSAEAGEVVAAGQTVARIARSGELEAVISVPEQRIAEAKAGRPTASLWNGKDKSYAVNLREVAAEANPQTRTFEFRYTIANPDDDIRIGKTVTLTLEKPGAAAMVRLPLSAVMNDGKGPMVWIVNATGDRIERRTVTVHAFEQDSVLISSGLAAQERVVTLGVHQLDANRKVRIVEQTSQLAGAVTP